MPPARPFACSACSRTFTRSENLERHKKTHHGGANAPSFACPKCRSRFSRRDVCKRHTLNCKESEPEVTPPRPVRVHPPPASAVVQEEQESRVETGSLDLSKVDLQSASSSPVEFQHDASASRPSPFLPADIIKKHIDLYFEEFHPSLPILHRATTTLASTPTIMLKILMSISSMYLRRPGTNMFEENRKSSHDLWASGGSELEVFVSFFPSRWIVLCSYRITGSRGSAAIEDAVGTSKLDSLHRVWHVCRRRTRYYQGSEDVPVYDRCMLSTSRSMITY